MTMQTVGFLALPDTTEQAQALYDEDAADVGFVTNAARLWAYQPDACQALFDLMETAFVRSRLSFRQRGVLVAACASTLGDAYCSLAWGTKLATAADPATAAAVLAGDDSRLSEQEKALAGWARQAVRDPNAATAANVQQLRDAGIDDEQIFAVTLFVALRLAFATVNDALGARPDAGWAARAPVEVREAVTFGRAVEDPMPVQS